MGSNDVSFAILLINSGVELIYINTQFLVSTVLIHNSTITLYDYFEAKDKSALSEHRKTVRTEYNSVNN